ncbi:hypothetical protein J6590_048511 [Homalodisca vitripennis]|nr:hypothetical protein J6590_048511 [Homalodisca vitripennis]
MRATENYYTQCKIFTDTSLQSHRIIPDGQDIWNSKFHLAFQEDKFHLAFQVYMVQDTESVDPSRSWFYRTKSTKFLISCVSRRTNSTSPSRSIWYRILNPWIHRGLGFTGQNQPSFSYLVFPGRQIPPGLSGSSLRDFMAIVIQSAV